MKRTWRFKDTNTHRQDEVVQVLGCPPDHLRPPHSFLQLHQSLLILVPLHQHSGHFHPGEAFSLCRRHVALRRPNSEEFTWFMKEKLPNGKFSCSQLTSSSSFVLCFTSSISSLTLNEKRRHYGLWQISNIRITVKTTEIIFVLSFTLRLFPSLTHPLLYFGKMAGLCCVEQLSTITYFLSSSSSSLFLSSSLLLTCSRDSSSPCNMSLSQVNSSSFNIKSLFTTFRAFLKSKGTNTSWCINADN